MLVIDSDDIFCFLFAVFSQLMISFPFWLSLLRVLPHQTFIILFLSLLLLLLQVAKLESVFLIKVLKKDYFQFLVFLLVDYVKPSGIIRAYVIAHCYVKVIPPSIFVPSTNVHAQKLHLFIQISFRFQAFIKLLLYITCTYSNSVLCHQLILCAVGGFLLSFISCICLFCL